jgi:tetratricopeptide (TPR) repeat protein
MSIEDHRYDLLDKVMKRDPPSDTVYVQMDRSHVLEDGKNKNADFKDKIITDKYSIEQFWGRPQMRGEGYVKTMPPPLRSAHEVGYTRENVRIYLFALTLHYVQNGEMENAYLCCEFLTRFDHGHYNHFELFGYVCMELGDVQRAIDNFTEAIRIFEEDPNWPIEDKKNHIAHLRGLIDSCRQLKNQKS